MLSEPEKKLVSSGKRKGHDQEEAQSVAESKRARAGFLAHEFLSRGTLLGRRWDPSMGAFEQGSLSPESGADSQASMLKIMLSMLKIRQ